MSVERISFGDEASLCRDMTYIIRMIGATVEEDDRLPARLHGDPPMVFTTADEAHNAGNLEIVRLAALEVRATFLIIDEEGKSVDHRGRRPKA